MIKPFKHNSQQRIPILLELQGKNLRSLTPEELLATWAYRYGIEVKALLQLHLEGRLLLIFEGFDKIDLSRDTEARINHFNTYFDQYLRQFEFKLKSITLYLYKSMTYRY